MTTDWPASIVDKLAGELGITPEQVVARLDEARQAGYLDVGPDWVQATLPVADR